MAHPRFFLDGPYDGGHVPLTDRDLHHARDVLRVQPGETIAVVTPDGHAKAVRVEEAADTLVGTVIEELAPERGPRVWLALGMPKGERTDLAVRMAVELGCAGVVPLTTERTVVRLDDERRRARGDRLRRVALEAAKQAQRSALPPVLDPIPLDSLRDALPVGCRLVVPWEEASGPGLGQALSDVGARADEPLAVVIGPEGGLAGFEVDALQEAGAAVCSLGSTVLRTETAAVVTLALVIHELGGLGAEDA